MTEEVYPPNPSMPSSADTSASVAPSLSLHETSTSAAEMASTAPEEMHDEISPSESSPAGVSPSVLTAAEVTSLQPKDSPAAATPDRLSDAASDSPTEASQQSETSQPETVSTATPPPPAEDKKKWYVVKVQSGREESIKNAIERRVKIEGLEQYFGPILIPTEKVAVVKKVTKNKGKPNEKTKEERVIKEQKKFPGYLFCNVEFNENVLYLFRETSGVGDFVGGSLNRIPTPMSDREVASMLAAQGTSDEDKGGGAKIKEKVIIPFSRGDRVKIRDGTFQGMDGEVKEITEPKESNETPRVKVELTIFGRPVPVDLEYWQVDPI